MKTRICRGGLLAWAACLALGMCWIAGCGGPRYQGEPRGAIEGTVSLDGQPVDGGTIDFMPVEPDGRVASALISGGRYEIPEERGPTPGKYRVEISWNKPLGPLNEDNPDAPQPSEQVVPAKYNRNSELERDIARGKRRQQAWRSGKCWDVRP
jgi:hypothetical protein